MHIPHNHSPLQKHFTQSKVRMSASGEQEQRRLLQTNANCTLFSVAMLLVARAALVGRARRNSRPTYIRKEWSYRARRSNGRPGANWEDVHTESDFSSSYPTACFLRLASPTNSSSISPTVRETTDVSLLLYSQAASGTGAIFRLHLVKLDVHNTRTVYFGADDNGRISAGTERN